VLVLRDIYNEFAKFRYELIATKTPIERVLAELENNSFFYRYKDNTDKDSVELDAPRLRCIFFAYPDLIAIYKENNYVLINNCTYKVYASGILLLCFDFVTRIGKVLLLAYVLMPDELFKGYE
jgi:hypothetical protein